MIHGFFPKSIYFYFFFWIIFTFQIPGENLFTLREKKGFRKEMIELDIQIRNLASAISMADSKNTLKLLSQLSYSSVHANPRYKRSLTSVYRKLKSRSLYFYLKNIREKSSLLNKKITRQLQHSQQPDWKLIQKEYQMILTNCRGCHIKMLPSNN